MLKTNFSAFLDMISNQDMSILALTLAIFGSLQWRRVVHVGAAPGLALVVSALAVNGSLQFPGVSDFLWSLEPGGGGPEKPGDEGLIETILDYGGTVFLGIGLMVLLQRVFDVSQKRQVLLKEAHQREAHLHDAAKVAKLGFFAYDTKGDEMIHCTEQHARSHGMDLDAYMKRSFATHPIEPKVHPDDQEMIRDKVKELRAGNVTEMEYRVLSPEGERSVYRITTPVFGPDGDVIREFGTSQDITEQRNVERVAQQSVKMEAIGGLTGGMAHDFNNVLAAILGNLELAKGRPKDLDERINAALAATLKGADLTKSMLSFARQAPLEPVALDLNALVLETKQWAARTLPSSIVIETSLLAGLWPIKVDRASAESALLNLMINARDAMKDKGRLTLETANVRADKDYIDDRGEDLIPGRYVMLAVSDTGGGIPDEILDRIFDPFFTTKGPGAGSGLGLSMIQGFMKQSKGTIRVYSEPGVGTSFKLYFRAAEQSVHTDTPSSRVTTSARLEKSQVILLAEDDPRVREVMVRTLGDAGYTVIATESGDDALAEFKKTDKVDIVLTDIVMPGELLGPALAKALRAIRPDLPIVFMTGYANEASVHGNGLHPGDIRLMKPVRRTELLTAIEEALASAPRSHPA